MRFRQLDTITELVPGQRIVARRTLRAEEDYLRDHFPHFPVMPGVMMLEACYQAAMWMVRTGDDFSHPLVLMREAKQVKFGDFLAPGETLEIFAETIRDDDPLVTIKVSARKEGKTTVAAKLVLERTAAHLSAGSSSPEHIRKHARKQFFSLFGDSPAVAALPPDAIGKPS